MIRSAAQLSKAADLSVAPHLLRPKTFIKKLDKNNEAYYVLAKKGLANNPDPDREYDFFEMPNLLLDLDADGTRHVRAVEDADEKFMRTKWAEVPRRTAVRARLKAFEEQVCESRTKARQVLSQPTNIWRITPHDIVSAALQGAPGPQRRTARASTPAAVLSEPTGSPRTSGHSEIMEKLLLENGIPPHAVNEDELLLRWMILRHKSLTQASHKQKRKSATSISPTQLSQALDTQTTILGVRRLVFQALSAGTSTSNFQGENKPDVNLPHQIRSACTRILSQHESSRDLQLQTLTFLGNLSERLSSLDTQLGPLLCGLALKLSAEIGSLEALSGWLYRAHHTGGHFSTRDELFVEDVLSSLVSIENILAKQQPVGLETTEKRQVLFQLLTGIDETDTMASDSFRTLGASFLDRTGSVTASRTFIAYLVLLGRLGAARTLWREWRESSSIMTDENVVFALCSALKQAVRVMPPRDGEHTSSDSLDECATLDYHAIGMHDAGARRLDSTAGQIPDDLAVCRSVLDLPLAQCIERVRAW